MQTGIITKFIIGADRDIKTLLYIAAATAREKYDGRVPHPRLEAYIEHHFHYKLIQSETSSISTQFLVVYEDGEPAGYARITSKGERPGQFEGKSAVRIADFSVLKKFKDDRLKAALLEKCLSVCSPQQITWIAEHDGYPDLALFETRGFSKSPAITGFDEFGLAQLYLVKEKSK
jgi:hypothetical protein